MKKIFILKSMLLLCGLIAGSGMSWADDTTVTWSITGVATSASYTKVNTALNASITPNGASGTWTAVSDGTSSYAASSSGAQLGASSNREFTGTVSLSNTSIPSNAIIKSVSVTIGATNASTSLAVTVNGNSLGDAQTITAASTKTFNTTERTGNSIVLTFTNTTASKYFKITGISVTYTSSGGGSSPSITANDVDVAYNVTNGSIAYTLDNATGNVSASVTEGNWLTLGTITASTVPFTCSANSSSLARTAKVTLSFTGASNKVVTITQAGNPNGSGSQTNPFTVAEANAATPTSGNVYISGIVSGFKNTTIIGDGTSYRYYISDDGTSTDQLLVYKGKKNSTDDFSDADDLRVGDRVVICGQLTTFSNAPEVASGNYIVSLQLVAPTFFPAEGAVGSGTELTISDAHTGATIYYTTDGTDPTTSSTQYNSSSKPTITSAMTIKAIAVKSGNENSAVSSASYTILVPAATPQFVPGSGTYNFAQDVELSCDTADATIYYTINGNAPTTSSTQYTAAIHIEETTTIKAIAVKEGMANSAVAEATYTMQIPSIAAEPVNIAYNATSGSISSTITNEVEGGVLTAAITGGNEGTWLSLGNVDGTNVPLTCSANEGNANRAATVTLTYTYNTNKTVTKAVTVTQAHDVKDYADLPFTWTSTFGTAPTGVTNNGVSTDSNGTYLKFDTDGDNIILKINERPGTLSFDIKGNPSNNEWSGTCNVETSDVNGTQWSSIASYTSVSTNSYDSKSIDLGENVRYIKWTYSKTKGNLAMNNITLTAYEAPSTDPSIVITTEGPVEVSAAAVSGELALSYANFDITDASDFAVQFYDSNNEVLSGENAPKWITVSVVTSEPSGFKVSYSVNANDGVARFAYFKVFAIANQAEVYSNRVTVSQAAYVPDFTNLPFVWAGGSKSELSAVSGVTLSSSGFDSDYAASNAPFRIKCKGDGAFIIIKMDQKPEVVTVKIKKLGGDGDSSISILASDNGENYSSIQEFDNEGDANAIIEHVTTNAFRSTDRYVKIVYNRPSSGGANIGLGQITISSLNLTATLSGGRYWTTFYSKSTRYALPVGAQAYTMNSSHELFRLGIDGSEIPAGKAVIIISDSANIELTRSTKTNTVIDNADTNILEGSNSSVIRGNATNYYVLGIDGETLGFYQYSGDSIPGMKAYYIVNNE